MKHGSNTDQKRQDEPRHGSVSSCFPFVTFLRTFFASWRDNIQIVAIPASRLRASQQIRVIREIRGLLHSAEQIRILLILLILSTLDRINPTSLSRMVINPACSIRVSSVLIRGSVSFYRKAVNGYDWWSTTRSGRRFATWRTTERRVICGMQHSVAAAFLLAVERSKVQSVV